MTKSSSHIIFDRSEANNANIINEEINGAYQAINLASENSFVARQQGEKEACSLCCYTNEVIDEEIQVLEVAFMQGKLRKTTFGVDYIDTEDKKHHIGTYESPGNTNSYTKYVFPEKVKDIQGIMLTFKKNDDGSDWFGVRGIRLARFVEKPL